MRYVPLVGRILFAGLFLATSFTHFSPQTIGYAAQHGVPAAGLLVPLAGVLSFLGGLSVLLGYHARVGAVLLILFLLPVTFAMHDFWRVSDPAAAMLQRVNFFKNLALVGGASMVAYFGAGPVSVDEWLKRRHPHETRTQVLRPT